MHPENFVYWLQGYFEISGANQLTVEQTEIVKRHLAKVLHHVDEPIACGIPGMARRLDDLAMEPAAPCDPYEPLHDANGRRWVLRTRGSAER